MIETFKTDKFADYLKFCSDAYYAGWKVLGGPYGIREGSKLFEWCRDYKK